MYLNIYQKVNVTSTPNQQMSQLVTWRIGGILSSMLAQAHLTRPYHGGSPRQGYMDPSQWIDDHHIWLLTMAHMMCAHVCVCVL